MAPIVRQRPKCVAFRLSKKKVGLRGTVESNILLAFPQEHNVNQNLHAMRKIQLLCLLLTGLYLAGCNLTPKSMKKVETDENGVAILTDPEIENLVKRSWQYVAMYNVNNKFAMAQGGWNTLSADTRLKDHTLRDIARPNNDSFYSSAMLDLRKDAWVVNLPGFDSKYVSLMVTAYDHYVHVPKTTRLGDFHKPEKILFYSERTEGYEGEPVEGIDNIFEATGDFISVVFRVMPHANEPELFAKVVEQIGQISIQSLSGYMGNEPKPTQPADFPEVGKTDLDIYENNLLEVMQFVFNHLTFNKEDSMDSAVLASFAPFGIIPGNSYDPETAVKIDGKKFRQVAEKIQKENLDLLKDKAKSRILGPKFFKPKGQTDLDAMLAVSIIGPIGLPMEEAYYPAIVTSDGAPMNAMHDYVIRMKPAEMPPSKAFWSLTLYDKANGFFIPNDYKKYSVGINAGMKLNNEGGIEVFVAAEKPDGVPMENWLPINRGDEDLDIILRVYVPDPEKLSEWNPPVAERID